MCSFVRQSTLAILFILTFSIARSQSSRCDSILWNFDVNQFAIDGDNLMADLADKGWTQEFFQTNEIDVTIYGATDCPGTYEYNSKLAGNRALYLRNYFEVSAFPRLTIANSYTIPERNCVKPGQGYNRADRVTALKVCWSGEAPVVSAETLKQQPVTPPAKQEPVEPIVSQEKPQTENSEPTGIKTETTTTENTTIQNEAPVVVTNEAASRDSALRSEPAAPIDSIAQTVIENVIADSALTIAEPISQETQNTSVDSINIAMLDSTVMLPSKPKKIFDIASTPELNKGDELIIEGLNFYPGSHRTLPEAKPILKKLLQIMKDNPTLSVEIQGHVCCASKPNEDGLDDETGDFKLSWNRAQYVRDYLIQNGIADNRISYRGFAMTRPLVYPEKTIQDQIKNRRVEILITSE